MWLTCMSELRRLTRCEPRRVITGKILSIIGQALVICLLGMQLAQPQTTGSIGWVLSINHKFRHMFTIVS